MAMRSACRASQLCWMFFLKIIDDQDQELELLKDGYRSSIPADLQWRDWAADPEGITGQELLGFVNGDLFPELKRLPLGAGPRANVVRDVFEDAHNYMKSGQLMRQVVNKINGIDFNNLAERQHFGDIYEQILNDLQSAGNSGEYYTPRAVTSFMARIEARDEKRLLRLQAQLARVNLLFDPAVPLSQTGSELVRRLQPALRPQTCPSMDDGVRQRAPHRRLCCKVRLFGDVSARSPARG